MPGLAYRVFEGTVATTHSGQDAAKSAQESTSRSAGELERRITKQVGVRRRWAHRTGDQPKQGGWIQADHRVF